MSSTAEPDEIGQEEQHYQTKPVDVTVCGPVGTRELPALGYPGYRTEQANATVGVRLLSIEPRRKNAVIICLSSDLWLSSSQAGAQAGSGGGLRWPAAVPYVADDAHELWVCTVSGTADVGVKTSNWTE